MKLVVATLILGALALGTRFAVGHLAPERVASASASGVSGVSEKGVTTLPDTIRSVRVTGTHGTFDLATRPGGTLDPQALDADRLTIVRALAAEGYLDAGVDTPRVRQLDSGLSIELPVITGARYVVRDVRLEGKQISRQPDLPSVPTLRGGQDALAARIDGNVALLREWLAHRGVRASVGARLDIDRVTQRVDVIFTVD